MSLDMSDACYTGGCVAKEAVVPRELVGAVKYGFADRKYCIRGFLCVDVAAGSGIINVRYGDLV